MFLFLGVVSPLLSLKSNFIITNVHKLAQYCDRSTTNTIASLAVTLLRRTVIIQENMMGHSNVRLFLSCTHIRRILPFSTEFTFEVSTEEYAEGMQIYKMDCPLCGYGESEVSVEAFDPRRAPGKPNQINTTQ